MKFSEWHRGSVRVKLTKCDKVNWSLKCHYASDIPFEWLHVWFVILLSYYFILRESDFLRNLAIILPLKSKLSGKFQRFNTLLKVSKYWKIVELWKIQLIFKNVKHFKRPKQRATLRKSFSLSPPSAYHQTKSYYVFVTKHFVREIYKNIQTFAFKVLHESSS